MSRFFLLPVFDRWLFYAPLSQQGALINKAAADMLKSGDTARFTPELHALVQSLADNETPPPQPGRGEVCPSFLGIIPTRGCNIGCVYCNFAGPTADKTRMDPRIAVTAVDWTAKRLAECGEKHFQIHFFGGEPFIAPEIVDIVVHRARYQAARYGLTTYFDASTNGVYSESRSRFIGDYFGGIVLSLDGPAQFHDQNRPAFNGRPTFDKVHRTAMILKDMPLDLCLRVCITQASVTHMEEITAWLCETYQPAVVNFESLTPGELAIKAGLQVPDPYLFAEHCYRAYDVAAGYGIKAVYSAAEYERARLSFCPVGSDALIVSLDGRASACYLLPEDWQARGLDLDVGWFHEDGHVDIDFDAVMAARRLPQHKPRCDHCFCQWSCAGGCHVNQTFPGAQTEYTEFCLQTRLLTAALLLRELDMGELARRLFTDNEAMQRLVHHTWDSFELPLPQAAAPASATDSKQAGSMVANGISILG